jgi:hypoxanthine phosphoribosyltransferase
LLFFEHWLYANNLYFDIYIGLNRQNFLSESSMKHTVEVMISEQEVRQRIIELGEQITAHYQGSDNLVMIGLLRGSFVFMADLSRVVTVYHSIDFMTASSYGSSMESSRDVRILKDLDDDIKGKDIILVEDIIDTGNTLTKVCEILSIREPNSISICTLLDKPSRREVPVDVTWVGFEIPDEFVVGVGIDYAQKYRNLPYIGKVIPQE